MPEAQWRWVAVAAVVVASRWVLVVPDVRVDVPAS
jgi:hypothetical protein